MFNPILGCAPRSLEPGLKVSQPAGRLETQLERDRIWMVGQFGRGNRQKTGDLRSEENLGSLKDETWQSEPSDAPK